MTMTQPEIIAALAALKKGESFIYHTGVTPTDPPTAFGYAAALERAGFIALVQRAIGTAWIGERGRVQNFEYIAQGLRSK